MVATWHFLGGGGIISVMTIFLMMLVIIIGSALSLAGGIALLRFKKRRQAALLLTMPFGAGALLAAAFFDLLPESLDLAEPRSMLLYCLGGFMFFFILERCATWFHHHHEHEHNSQNAQQRRLIMLGDMTHNAIDGIAIGAAFLVSIPTGIITTLAVSAHEIPKELGTFALLLTKGWKDKTVILANLATALATILAALLVYTLAKDLHEFVAPLLAMTSGFFIYVAASDIIPDIHEQPQKIGTIQALMLVGGVVIVGWVITLLGV
ncbi:MAG: putative Zinc/iron permease [Candidatus Saccharibacteria bacterium]|nr:putative Zinc/iron permease [Candidatus Saccharibacteria bacterium]